MGTSPDDQESGRSDAPALAVAARRAGSRLFATYATISLVPVVLLGAALGHGYRQEAHDRALDQGRAQAAVIEEMAIAPALDDGDDLDRGLRDAGLARLQRATDLAIFQGSVVQLRLRSFSGKVAFSDDGSTAGALSTEDPAFRAAATGGTAVAIVPDPRGEPGEVIRVLQPVIAQANGRSAGVLELYLPYAAIAESLQQQTQRTYQRIGGGLAGLYVVLALLSWSTTRRLRRHAAQRERDALTDSLTLLPNREMFRLRAEAAVEQTPAGAVVLVDLDHFKEVNDTLGHHAGDALLRVVAERLVATLRADDTVARLGGDEFGLVLPGMPDADAAVALLAGVRQQLAAEVLLDGVPLTIEASFGIALYPQHGRDVEQLLRHADAAMYRGKRDTGGIVAYTPGMTADTAPTLVVQSEIRRALERDELLLHYQPKIDLGTGQICGLEALVRWQHPERGLLLPQAFLPAVEQSGLIDPLTAWVLRRALLDRAEWAARGMRWPVAVNVSARNLETATFADSVADLLVELGTPADQLVLEVTETALAVDAVGAAGVLAELARQGIDVSIDDFGTGYTCLWQLETLPVSEVKIDRAFVRGLGQGGGEHPVVRAVIALVHGLGCRVTAEGVETPEAAAWLAHAGCDQGQGYLFSRPAPWHSLVQPSHATPVWHPPLPTGSHDLIRSLT